MKSRKSLSILLALLLVFSQFTFAAAAPIQKIDGAKVTKNVQKHGEKVSKEELDKLYAPTDKVRVIVEVDEDAAITYATQQGKKYSELSVAKQEELQNKALAAQDAVKKQLSSKKVDMEFEHSFTTVFNGFSGYLEYRNVELLQKFDGVVDVTIANEYKRPEVTPDMRSSKELVEAQKTWDEYGYDGKGMIIGVIDSGVDPTHRDFVLTNEEEAALSEDEIEQFVAENNLPGKYYSPKVPYGYNYMDENAEVRDLGPGASMHGMHVSGTVGANGDEENGGLKGVAPEAQILGLKVFGNDPEMGSTYGDVYIKAIDDAIILGADVINMSLGSTAAFVSDEDPEQQAVAHAVENGVLMSISAGNSAFFGDGFFNPLASNPDYGVVGSPGVSVDSLQVASIENSFIDLDAMEFNYGETTGLAPFMSASAVHPNDIDAGPYEIVYVETGTAEGFAGKDVAGKFALAVRGNAFTDTALNAVAAGAAGVIVYNHSDGWINMQSDPGVTIPQLFMSKTDGDELKAALDAGETVTISFNGDKAIAENELADSMSQFSSWGLTPNLDFKPEITAPGGSILSTLNDDQYGLMNGTSMAAPHVAGGSALVLQRVDEEFNLEGRDRVEFAKNILMNTAAPVVDKGDANTLLETGLYYSPRKQGAGLMQLHKAISTPVVVTEETTGLGKVALREVGEEFSFTLVAENFSDEDATYDIATQLQTDFQVFGLMGNAYLTGAIGELEAAELVGDVTINDGESTVTVPANGTATIEVTVDLSEAEVFTVDDDGNYNYLDPNEVFPNGYWVEGFVTLTDATGDTLPQLSVPYVGFAGEWDAAPIVDALAYEGSDYSYYETGSMLYDNGKGDLFYLGRDPFNGADTNNIAISPNGDNVGDQAIPLLSFLRNAKTIEYIIQDENGKELRKLGTEKNIRKHYYDSGRGPMYTIKTGFAWDGKVKNKLVEDGQYYLNVKATVDYEGAEAQDFLIPVKVDTVVPKLEANVDGTVLTINTTDDNSGVRYVEVIVGGKSLGVLPADQSEVNLGEVQEGTAVEVVAVDWAGNVKEVTVGGPEDTVAPVINVTSPEAFSFHDTNEVNVSGTVEDASEIVEFTVDGKEVGLTRVESGVYSFNTTMTFEDGTQKPKFVAVDAAGNESTLANSRLFFVDTTAPELSVVTNTTVQSKTAELTINVADNGEEIRLYVDGNEVYYNEMPGYEMVPFEDTVTVEVELKPGQNALEVKAVDYVGNETVQTVEVYREHVDRLAGQSRYDTAVRTSQKGWESSDVVILARGDEYADALAGVPLAGKYDAPLLLTQSNKLTAETKAEIERLGATKVVVLGGQAAISSYVTGQLVDSGLNVERIAGDNRVDTAVEVAKKLAGEAGVTKAVVVNGYNFPDALSVASYAAAQGLPVLLTQTNTLSAETAQALTDLGVTDTVVVGGPLAVSEKVFGELPNAERVSGQNRYATGIEVAKHFGLESEHLYVATGQNFADALSSAALAAKEGTGVVLVGNNLPKEVSDYLAESGVVTATIVGGPLGVNEGIQADLNKLLAN